jgi:hypothetical protein
MLLEDATALYVGVTPVAAVYAGATQVWTSVPAEPPDLPLDLTATLQGGDVLQGDPEDLGTDGGTFTVSALADTTGTLTPAVLDTTWQDGTSVATTANVTGTATLTTTQRYVRWVYVPAADTTVLITATSP